jgi:hypothetical protein
MQDFMGKGFNPDPQIKKKVYLSTKRGRKLGLSRYLVIKKKTQATSSPATAAAAAA